MRRCIALLLALAAPAARAAAQPARAESVKPDFSTVTSPQRIGAQVRKGSLVRVLLFPAELGGEDVTENRVYVTPEAAAALKLITGTLLRFTAEGLLDKLDVHADYRDDSLVPTRIVMHATHSSKQGEFNPTVEVW